MFTLVFDKHWRYNHSEKGLARNRRYSQSLKGLASVRRYKHTPKGIVARLRFDHSEKRKMIQERFYAKHGGQATYEVGNYHRIQEEAGCHWDVPIFYPAYRFIKALENAEVVEI